MGSKKKGGEKRGKAKTPHPKGAKQKFTVTTASGDTVRVEYDENFRHHMAYRGPVSETGYRSDFSFDGKGDPKAYATKKANEFQAELVEKKAKGAKKHKDEPAVTAATPKAPKKAGRKDGKMSGLDAAVKILADAGEPLNCKAILERILAKGLWKTGGKTPEATLSAAMGREIVKRGPESRFKKADRGLFTLTLTA